MNARAPEPTLHQRIRRRYGALRRVWTLRVALRAAALICVLLALAVVAGVLRPLGPAGAWARLALTATLATLALAWAIGRQRRAWLSFAGYLERIEERFPEVRSWLRNALELEARPPLHASSELARALSAETARRFAGVRVESLAPRLEPRRPALAFAGALIVIAALGLASPARVQRSWATLWDPAAAAPPVRLAVEPGSVRITPGATLAIRARVWGTARRPVLWRDRERGVLAVDEGTGEAGARVWRFDLTPLTREQRYRVRVANVVSPTYRIALAGDPSPVSFEVEYLAPAYARLPVQRGTATRGDLSALRGTRARVEVTFDRDLEALEVSLPGGVPAAFRALTPRRWQGEIAVEREGEYTLTAASRAGPAGPGRGRFRYRITPLPDAPPVIAVRTPAGDLDLPAGQQVPVEVFGQDDLGLSALELEYHKDPAAPWARVPLARFAGQPREASVSASWDAAVLALLPGESATFRFALYDDNAVSGRGRALSPTFQIRFPGLAELYEKVDERQAGAQSTLEKAAEQARELQKSLDRLARQPTDATSQRAPAFERSEELRSALERQQGVSQKIDQASGELRESLEQAAERQAFNETLTRKLREMSELMNQIQSPEFREALRRLQQAIQELDRRTLEQGLPEWRKQNQETLANLERSIDLLKRLREEERLDALAKRADELRAQQDALNRAYQDRQGKTGNPERREQARALAERQRAAAGQTEQLTRDAKEVERSLEEPRDREAIQQAEQELQQNAQPSQQEAADAEAQQRDAQARASGERGSQSLSKASRQLARMVEARQQEREGLDLSAVRRAAQDLVSLQRASEDNLDSSAPASARADRATDLSDGVARVADSLYTLAQRTPFISRKLATALGRATQRLAESGRELAAGDRQGGEEAGRGGGEALNEAVLQLRAAEGAMCQKPGSGKPGPSRSSAQRVGEMGQRQSDLNQESRSLAQRLSQQMRLSAGDRDQLQRLAEEQQRIREQLEQIQRDEERNQKLLGRLDAARREMKEVEEALKQGSTGGDLDEKQQRILSRLLDAQRSVNRRDYDPERESRPGEDVARRSPAELPPELLRVNDRLRLDLLKAGADRYPAQYRAFVELYLRSLNGTRR